MAFQTPLSIAEMLIKIHKHEYLMPAIQREFVWGPDQIIKLLDSLMRGYPVGSFLLWQVEPVTAQSYTFYEFLTHYHERDKPYANKATVPSGHGTMAVLDGQQRLTSLNIALYGSFAEKKKYAWWSSPDAFPVRRLYLNLAAYAADEELGLRYDLRFLTDKEATAKDGEPRDWFKVGDVLGLKDSGPAIMNELAARSIVDHAGAFQRLYDLFQAVRELKPMNYFLVADQDPDKVLEIFVRVNSGGTPLSYSDLLLSMATNQWKDLDAREEVRSLVAELNSDGGRQFAFSKDLVLKTALAITGVDLRFKVSNFTQGNMTKVEQAWPAIRAALIRAADLLAQFGFTDQNLTANSVAIPIAYYLHQRRVGDSYLTSAAEAADRLTIQGWVTRSLLKRGFWGSGLDSTLMRIRDVLTSTDATSFPVADVDAALAAVGKGLSFDASEVDELLNLKYGGQSTFTALSILYPGLDFSKAFHQDHIFPRATFTKKRLAAAGVAAEHFDAYMDAFNLLPNLQLLGGTANTEKQAALPDAWIGSPYFASDEKRSTYLDENDLSGLPLGITEFLAFFAERKARIRQRLLKALGAPLQPHEVD